VGIRRKEYQDPKVGVYVHIPYCTGKCYYCSFNSIPSAPIPEKEYVECILKELTFLIHRQGLHIGLSGLESIYFGGGTPSIFSPESIERMIDGITAAFKRQPDEGVEITLEANPETLEFKRLKGFRGAGVNRLSLGVQSFNDDHLKALGRRHDSKKAVEGFYMARDAGFDEIGIDLIYGLPTQKKDDWEASLNRVIKKRPEHVSIYGLTIEEGTPFHAHYSEGKLLLPSEEEQVSKRQVTYTTRYRTLRYPVF
jgi:oxygen-independent coproporphyrinogen-3 oxidase